MAWKMIGKPTARKVTTALASEFASMMPAPHDRDLRPGLCNALRAAVELGKFRTCSWATAYCEQTKLKYRVNGKHTSTVLSQLNGSIPDGLYVTIEEYHCDTLEDVAMLYSTFDPRESARLTGDINKIFSAVCGELDEVPSQVVNLCVSGMAANLFSRTIFGAYNEPREKCARLLLEYPQFVLFVDDLRGDTKQSVENFKACLRRKPVASAMFSTWRKSRVDSVKFWEAVRDATGQNPNTPDRRLNRFLLTSSLFGAGIARTGKKSVNYHEMMCRAIAYWNLWRQSPDSTEEVKYRSTNKIPAAR